MHVCVWIRATYDSARICFPHHRTTYTERERQGKRESWKRSTDRRRQRWLAPSCDPSGDVLTSETAPPHYRDIHVHTCKYTARMRAYRCKYTGEELGVDMLKLLTLSHVPPSLSIRAREKTGEERRSLDASRDPSGFDASFLPQKIEENTSKRDACGTDKSARQTNYRVRNGACCLRKTCFFWIFSAPSFIACLSASLDNDKSSSDRCYHRTEPSENAPGVSLFLSSFLFFPGVPRLSPFS